MSSVHDYSDIINIPRPDLKFHQRMPVSDRAAQFSPFAALTGFSGLIEETSRTTRSKIVLDERETEKIGRRLRSLNSDIKSHPEVEVTYFVPDSKKEGGSYRTMTGRLQKMDEPGKRICFESGEKIGFDDIIAISRKKPGRSDGTNP